MVTTSSPHQLEGVAMPAWLLRFDAQGNCTSPVTRAALLRQMQDAPPTDVIVFCHGWNNDADDAIGMYAAFMRHFETLGTTGPPDRPFDPVFIGLLWPSIWWPDGPGPVMASGAMGSSAGGAAQMQGMLAALAARITATSGPGGLDRLFALLAAPAISDADAAELAVLIAPAFGVAADEGAAQAGRSTVAQDVLAMMQAMQTASPIGQPPPPDDLDDFSRPATPAGPGALPSGPRAAGRIEWLDPRQALRLFSLYQMKDRAGTVGYNGIAALLADLLTAPGVPSRTRIHGVGHSFGCKVLLSALCAQALPRPLASLLLLQPAVSHLCFADDVAETGRPGGYRAALSAERVTPPIVSTYTRQDTPLHRAFHLAVRRAGDLGEAQIASDGASTTAGPPPSRYAALGGYGPRQAGQQLVDPLPPAGTAITWPPGGVPIVGLDGSQGVITGHGDITSPALAWVLRQLVFR